MTREPSPATRTCTAWIVPLVLCLCSAGLAAEAWFLPYTEDGDTLLLASLDDDTIGGSAGGELQVVDGAQRTDGRFGKAIHLEGPKQHLRIKSTEAIRFGRNDPFTVELWVRPATGRGGGLWACAIRFYLHVGTKAQFGYRSSSFPIRYSGLQGLRLPPKRWSHVALTHDAQRRVRIYVNGSLVDEVTHNDEGDYAEGASTLVVGAHDGWTNFLVGDVDEIRVSRGVRTFRPLLEQAALLAGESLRLGLSAADLPAGIASVNVTVRHGGDMVHEAVVPRDRLGQELLPVAALPPGKSELQLQFRHADGQEVSTTTASVENSAERYAGLQQRHQELSRSSRAAKDGARWPAILRDYCQSIQQRLEARRLDEAEQRLTAAERIAAMIASGETAHRVRVRDLLRQMPRRDDVRVSMSWRGANAEDAFPWAERLGANELIASSPTADYLRTWKSKGYHTVWLHGFPIHDTEWLRENPANRQRGYWVSRPFEAQQSTVELRFRPPTWSGYRPEWNRATQDWKLVDGHGNILPTDQWKADAKQLTVTVLKAIPGESYRVYYTFRATTFLDPLAPGSVERGTTHLTELLEPLRGVLDTYWFDDIGYGYPGNNEHSRWDWESYTLAAGPSQVQAFTADTGIPFDPVWLVNLPRAIDGVPDPRYLAWMHWVRDRLKPFISSITDVVHDAGAQAWLYWGDCHVGMEPYGGSLETFDQVDKPSADPVTLRALTDFPGDTFRRMRTDWLFSHTARDPRSPARHWQKWLAPRQALLRKPKVQGLYWMVFDTVANAPEACVRDDLVETLAAVSDEFRLTNQMVGGATAFAHNINVVVLSAWGSNYAWRPWGSRVLWHLADLPLEVSFESFQNVAAAGLPEACDVLFLYGMPDTAWSGGHFWADGRVAAAVRQHVQRGGGLVALQAPSAWDGDLVLHDLLGVRLAGEQDKATVRIDSAELADTADDGEQLPKGEQELCVTKSGQDHWIAAKGASRIAGLHDVSSVKLEADDATLLAVHRDSAGTLGVGAVARRVGRGRVVYVAGISVQQAFSRLLRNALFWAAAEEQNAGRLEIAAAQEGLSVQAYPDRRILAVDNTSAGAVQAAVRCDPALFTLTDTSEIRLADAVSGCEVCISGTALRTRGAELPAAPHSVTFWHVHAQP